MKAAKAFLDANVVISAFTSGGVSSKLFDLLSAEHEIIVSPQVLTEFRRITVEKFGLDEREADDFLMEVRKNSTMSMPPYERRIPVRDPDDVDILAAALKSGATYLVTGDKDLLEVDTGGAIQILRPRELLDLLSADG